MKKFFFALPVFLVVIAFAACNTIDLFEKTEAIPEYAWKKSYKPSFTFTIKDTTVPYRIFFVLRWDPLESTCRHASLSIL